jgi:hypothetical protein
MFARKECSCSQSVTDGAGHQMPLLIIIKYAECVKVNSSEFLWHSYPGMEWQFVRQ